MTPKEILEKRDALSYIDMIDQIERGVGKVIYCGMDGIVTIADGNTGFIAPFDSDVRPFVELLPRSVELISIHREKKKEKYKWKVDEFCSSFLSLRTSIVPIESSNV